MISLPLFLAASLVLLAVGVAAGYYFCRVQHLDEHGGAAPSSPPDDTPQRRV